MTLPADPAPSEHHYSDVVQVFEANALTLPKLDEYVAELIDRREFISELASAEVRGQRSNTFMGELWTLIDPMFQAGIYMFLFLVIRGSSGRTAANVTTIVGCVFLFNYTRISISDGGRAVLRSKGLVLNAIFPRAVLPIAEVYKGFRSTVPALLLYGIIHVLVHAPITASLLLLPLLLAIHTGINLGLAFLLSTATSYFTDVAKLLSYVLRILMFATPVIYPVAFLSPGVRQVLSWNPLFALFATYQAVITGTPTSAGLIIQALCWAVVTMALGLWVFLRHERSFGLHI